MRHTIRPYYSFSPCKVSVIWCVTEFLNKLLTHQGRVNRNDRSGGPQEPGRLLRRHFPRAQAERAMSHPVHHQRADDRDPKRPVDPQVHLPQRLPPHPEAPGQLLRAQARRRGHAEFRPRLRPHPARLGQAGQKVRGRRGLRRGEAGRDVSEDVGVLPAVLRRRVPGQDHARLPGRLLQAGPQRSLRR